eukprot:3922457-Rhodomonas_salina.4
MALTLDAPIGLGRTPPLRWPPSGDSATAAGDIASRHRKSRVNAQIGRGGNTRRGIGGAMPIVEPEVAMKRTS